MAGAFTPRASMGPVQSQMTDVPDNRTSQMAEFKQIEEVYKIIVFF